MLREILEYRLIKYKCPYDKCEKCYGSEISLNLHMRIKHNGGSKIDRENLAVLFYSIYNRKI